MGICLDTDANTSQDDEPGAGWKNEHYQSQRQRISSGGGIMTPNGDINYGGDAAIVTQNTGKIKFDPPKVPVIFVLGGPGSGKVTHCDTLMQEKRGVIHINMMDLLQQYAMGNDMQDFSQLSSKTVTEVLMLEIKMAPAAKAYLISGYPRSMRDVVEYSEKIQVVNGVVLISWRQSVLQKQIDYGAKLGHVVLSLAKMELQNFFKNVMPVADYFDQSDMLVAVNGERAPTEVYKDFRAAALDILSTLENQEAILNGVSGMGKGIHDIPGSIVSVDTAPSQEKNITEFNPTTTTTTTATATAKETTTVATIAPTKENQHATQPQQHHVQIATVAGMMENSLNNPSGNAFMHQNDVGRASLVSTDPTMVIGRQISPSLNNTKFMNGEIPPCIWVIGGPGSNKAMLCMKAVSMNPGWAHLSIGRILRQITESAPRANTEGYLVKEALTAGDMAPEKIITNLLDTNLKQLSDKNGIVIDGLPRSLQQAQQFELMYKQRPPIILLDCSKLQLGRGRVDDTVSSFRRRLELFREQTLPMLKIMDSNKRLIIVDGDTDNPSVQHDFEKIIRSHIQKLNGTGTGVADGGPNGRHMSIMRTMSHTDDMLLQDLDGTNAPGVVPTISRHVSIANGHLRSNSIHPSQFGGAAAPVNGHLPNGYANYQRHSNQMDNYI